MIIIEITNKNRVCRAYTKKEGMEADNVKTFEVDALPKIEENSVLYFNPHTKQFRQIPINPPREAAGRTEIDTAEAVLKK